MIEAGYALRKGVSQTRRERQVMDYSNQADVPHEIYQPRAVTQLGVWQIENTSFKAYGILAEGKDLTPEIIQDADLFIRNELPAAISREGSDNGLGFVIVHAGELGVSIAAHWWIQGSVICQKIQRKLYGADKPMDTSARPVIACVWELGLIDAEQKVWRDTMMIARPNPAAYLTTRVTVACV